MDVQNTMYFDGSFLKYEGLKSVCEYADKSKSVWIVTWDKNRYNELVLKFTFKSYFDGKLYGAPRYYEEITDDFDYALEMINAVILSYSPVSNQKFTSNLKFVTVFFKESRTGKWVKKGVYSKNLLEKSKSIVLKSAPMKSTRKQQKDGKKMYGQYKGMVGDVKQMGKQFSKNFKKLI